MNPSKETFYSIVNLDVEVPFVLILLYKWVPYQLLKFDSLGWVFSQTSLHEIDGVAAQVDIIRREFDLFIHD